MEEVFVPLKIRGFEDCKISNFGRFMTTKGKIKKPRFIDGTLRIDLRKIKNKETIARLQNISLAHLVYTHFSNHIPKGEFYVKYKDGNRLNCHIDNLAVAIHNPTVEQIKAYEINVIACVKDIIRKSSFFQCFKSGFDIDNCIGESCYLIWKYLSNWEKQKTSFYYFCKKYVRIALLQEYKSYKIMRCCNHYTF